MPPGISAQPLHAEPLYALRNTWSLVPRTITSTCPALREIAAGADRVAPGSSWVLLTAVQPEPGTHDFASMPLSEPRQKGSRMPLPLRTETVGADSIGSLCRIQPVREPCGRWDC